MARRGRVLRAIAGPKDDKARVVRAETRRSAVILLLIGDRPEYPLPTTWTSESSVRDFIRSQDWTRPWGAGSHAGHLISYLVMNGLLSDGLQSNVRLLETAFEETGRYQDPDTGTWGLGDLSTVQRINGAMKMLAAYQKAERPIPHPRHLIDYTLDNASGEDGCGVLDRLYVLHRASVEAPGYRCKDLEKVALLALDEITSYRQSDGGFSFYPASAQHTYYGSMVSLGGRQSDLHGTALFTWALSIALDMLGVRQECGWQISEP